MPAVEKMAFEVIGKEQIKLSKPPVFFKGVVDLLEGLKKDAQNYFWWAAPKKVYLI